MASTYELLLEEFEAGRSGFSGKSSSRAGGSFTAPGVSNGVTQHGPGSSSSNFTSKFGPGDKDNGHGNDANRFDPTNPGHGKPEAKPEHEPKVKHEPEAKPEHEPKVKHEPEAKPEHEPKIKADRGEDGNNGHGNDDDGFDESNPGNKPHEEDLPSLFTVNNDAVNFNSLADPALLEDVVAKNANDGMHEALAGDDYVKLPYSTTIAADIGYDTTITFNGGEGNDTIIGDGRGSWDNRWTQVDDTINGGAGDDLIWGGEGDDTIYGGDGADVIYSGYDLAAHHYGDSPVWGVKSVFYSNGYDTDYVDGGAGDDYIVGSWGNDELHGGDGADIIYGGMSLYNASGNDTIYGEAGNDYINGGYGNNTIYGGAGDDSMVANTGADTFIGGTGNDSANGGSGNDTFIHNSGDSDGNDRYRGDGGYDTLHLNLTQADYDASLAELATAQNNFSNGDTGWYNIASLGINVLTIENIDVTVDGIDMDFMSDFADTGADFG